MKSQNITTVEISGEWYAITDTKVNVIKPASFIPATEKMLFNTTDIEGNIVNIVYTGATELLCQQAIIGGLDKLAESATIRGNISAFDGVARTYSVVSFPNFDNINKLISATIFINHEHNPPMDGFVTVNASGNDFIEFFGKSAYDYLWDKFMTGQATFAQIIQEAVMYADMDGSINRKLYQ